MIPVAFTDVQQQYDLAAPPTPAYAEDWENTIDKVENIELELDPLEDCYAALMQFHGQFDSTDLRERLSAIGERVDELLRPLGGRLFPPKN
jgi:hypothetical protein